MAQFWTSDKTEEGDFELLGPGTREGRCGCGEA